MAGGVNASLWQSLHSLSHQPYLHSGTLHTTRAVICSLYSPLSGREVEKLLQNLFVTLKLYSQVSLYMASSVLQSQERAAAMGYIIKGELEFPGPVLCCYLLSPSRKPIPVFISEVERF